MAKELTFRDPHAAAKRIAKKLKAMGFAVDQIENSVNRNRQKSAYFTVGLTDKKFMNVRVSDHFGNPDYITAHANLIGPGGEYAFIEFVEQFKMTAKKPKRKVKSVRKNPSAKRPTKKQLAARRKFVAAVRAGKFREKVKRKTVKRKAPAKRKTVKRNPAKKRTFGQRKFVIRATYETKKGYRYYYLRRENWVALKRDAQRYGEKTGRARMQAIKGRLEPGITQIVLIDA